VLKVTLNGKPLTKDSIEEAIVEQVVAHFRERLGSIRHPETGEFPTILVTGTDLSDLKVRVEGSPALLELVQQRLNGPETSEVTQNVESDPSVVGLGGARAPNVFLSHASEDAELAKSVAEALTQHGIETWWSPWCIGAGDSIRQRIDEGLGACTHFVVLLTPRSLDKPWVNAEMDAGLIQKLNMGTRFIALRCGLAVSELPPLLQSAYSPEVSPEQSDWHQLVNDIHGITRKPPLGPQPSIVAQLEGVSSGASPAATALARLFVEGATHALSHDPVLEMSEVAGTLSLSSDDLEDALHELNGLVSEHFGRLYPQEALFARFDRFWMPWTPEEDAVRIAAGLVSDDGFPDTPEEISEVLGWPPRRLNPALTYLIERELVSHTRFYGATDWVTNRLAKTAATRRFVKSPS
jgi:hypothetical protein